MLPEGIVSTGWPATEATCRKIGIGFDPWQAELNQCILAKDADGLYAADTVALSICRQAGKTYDVGALVFADSIIHPGMTTVWTAHRFKVARESFSEMRAWAKRPALRHHIDYDEITTAAGNESIPFRNGSRILFAARERGAIRGFTKVRRLVLDEAQILTEHALADLVPTMNQAVNPQVILMGTPPKPTDPSDVWLRMRAEALAGESEGTLYVEFAAPRGSDPLDRAAWAAANPSYPLRTGDRAIMRLYKLLGAEDFPREGLGIWDDAAEGRWLVIPEAAWSARAMAPVKVSNPAFGIAASWPDAENYAIAVAGAAEGRLVVQVLEHRPGRAWVPDVLKGLAERNWGTVFAMRDRGPTGALHADMTRDGFEFVTPWVKESAAAFAAFRSAVVDGEPLPLGHFNQEVLTGAVAAADRQPAADGWVWMRKGEADISPVEAATAAVWGHLGIADYDMMESFR